MAVVVAAVVVGVADVVAVAAAVVVGELYFRD